MTEDAFGLDAGELSVLKPLRTPAKVQDFLDTLKINFELTGDTCMSPRKVLRSGMAQCMEGAMLAALALRLHGHRPLVMDLTTNIRDVDHVVTVFEAHGRWGGISKTNHPILRYREPVYRDIRELAMSYFHEYFMDDGRKTMRSYSKPLDLSRFDDKGWMTSEENIFYIPEFLDNYTHIPILTRGMVARLRRADKIEIEATKMTEWKG